MRNRGDGSWSSLPDGRWCYQVSLGVGADGRRRRPRFYGRTQQECRDQAEAHRAALREGRDPDGYQQRLADFLDGWLDGLLLAPASIAAYRSVIDHHIKPKLGRHRLADVTPAILRRWVVGEVETNGASRARYALLVLGAALSQAELDGMVVRNAVRMVKAPAVPRKRRKAPSAAQVRAFLELTADTRYGPLFAVTAGLGARMGEVLGLRWGDVDLETRVVYFRQQLRRGIGKGARPELATIKTGDSGVRTLPMPEFVAAAFVRQRERQQFERITAGNAWVEVAEDLVFRTRVGRPTPHNTVWYEFKRQAKASGLPETMTFHDLRHATATLLRTLRVDMRTIQMILGHATLRTTELYVDELPELTRDALTRLDDLLS